MNDENFSPEFSKCFDNRVIVVISKMGGGTVGKKYTNEMWSYLVLAVDGISVYRVAKGNAFRIGKPASHETAADIVHDYYSDGEI